jgi:CzcA family heavy metal efflux pump
MMSWIVRSSLKFRFIIVAAAAVMMVAGAGQLRHSKIDVFPEFAPPKVEIQTMTLGLTASETEELVTVPMEHALNGVPHLDTLRSKSVPQLSSIVLIFDQGTDLLSARQVVAERMATVAKTLPTWAAPPVMIQPLSSTSRVMKIGLSSASLNRIQMSTLAYWKIRARLLRVPGVANVPIWGEQLEQLQVQVHPERLQANGVTLDRVMNVTADSLDAGLLKFSEGGFIGTGGSIETPNQRFNVRHNLAIRTPDDLAQVPVATTAAGAPLLLRDVADVKIDHQPLIGDAVINGGPGLMLIVEKLPWANTVDVTRGVEDAIRELQPGLPGMEIDTTIFRPASFVEQAIGNLTEALLLGSLLVVVVLALFLFSWRSALISLITIPLSLTASALVLHLRGATINTMVLAGFIIALGAVVDDAIVDTENIVRRLREHRRAPDGHSTARVIFDASLEVRGAVVFASMIEALALLPVFFLSGLTGSFFRPLAFSYALAVLVSMLVALITTPALSLILLKNARLERRESPLVGWLQRIYVRVLRPVVRAPLAAYLTVAVIVVLGIGIFPRLGQELLPEFKERDFLMHWVTKPDTSQIEETRISTAAAKELQAIPGVRNFGAHIGQAFLMDEVVGVNFGENWISVDPDADYDKTVARVQEVVDGYPGLRRDVQTYLKERIKEVLTGGSSETIVVRIFGDDLEKLRESGEKVKEAIASVDGTVEENVELQADVPQVVVEVDLAAAESYGLKPGDVRRAAATFVASEEVGDIYQDGKAYDVHVWSTPEARNDVTAVRALPIDTPDGRVVRLDQVADVNVKPTPNEIHHQDVARTIEVGTNVRGRDLGSVAHEVEERLEKVDLPLGFRTEVEGEYQERQESNRRLFFWGIVAAAGIFFLLVTSFKSVRLALLSFFTLPMALVGGLLAAYFFGSGIISLGSLVGFFTILGVVARNGIMQISHFQHLEEHEGETFGPELVLRGAKERLSPILMTALCSGLALVPLLAVGSVPGQEIEYPMAIVIVGGLVTATLLNLFVVPSLYLQFAKRRPPVDPSPAETVGSGT